MKKRCYFCRTRTAHICDRCGRPACQYHRDPVFNHTDGHLMDVSHYCCDCISIQHEQANEEQVRRLQEALQ